MKIRFKRPINIETVTFQISLDYSYILWFCNDWLSWNTKFVDIFRWIFLPQVTW